MISIVEDLELPKTYKQIQQEHQTIMEQIQEKYKNNRKQARIQDHKATRINQVVNSNL